MGKEKIYIFEYPGTKEEFLKALDPFPGQRYDSGNYFYLGEYIVKFVGENVHFGVARGGHSGGYWFIPQITEFDDHIELRGAIEYIGPRSDLTPIGRLYDKIEMILLTILLSPVVLLVKLYTLIEWVVRKLLNRPKPKEKTEEDGLYDLMEHHFGCIRK